MRRNLLLKNARCSHRSRATLLRPHFTDNGSILPPLQGRLKLLGTLVFPKGKYATLKPGSGHVLCEDVFETMVRRLMLVRLVRGRIPVLGLLAVHRGL